MPRKDAPEFYYSKSRDAYRKRLRNPVTGKWDIEVWGKTKAIAREKADWRQAQLDAMGMDGQLHVWQYAARWYELNTVNLSPKGRANHKNAINNHICPVIGHMLLAEVKPDDIKAVMAAAGSLSKSTQQKIVTTLKMIFGAAEDSDLILKSPCRNIKAGGRKAVEKKPLTQAQQRTVLEALKDERIYPFILLCLLCGLRREEAFALQWDCVHLDDAAPYIEVRRAMRWISNQPVVSDQLKSDAAERNIPVPDLLRDELRALPHDGDFVCHIAGGKPYSETAYRRAWEAVTGREVRPVTYTSARTGKEVCVRLKLGDKVPFRRYCAAFDFHFSPHQLRHTYITELILSGTPLKRVQYLAGHSSVKLTLDVYAHLLDNAPADALQNVNDSFKHLRGSIEGTTEIDRV